ncbi:unnamed protein product [Dovyalis caffra]|uniref:Uncharacterized protein n=1 Tax=Dovyalis caffra TaxID=77055 RepID=A0AAV1QYG7_9ROSI|nr:unnamed protein product [Dovyalis caffra]
MRQSVTCSAIDVPMLPCTSSSLNHLITEDGDQEFEPVIKRNIASATLPVFRSHTILTLDQERKRRPTKHGIRSPLCSSLHLLT